MRLLIYIVLLTMSDSTLVFDFNSKTNLYQWRIINDGVMGGISESNLFINDSGHAQFSGRVRLEYNGGFASIRHRLNQDGIKQFSQIVLKVKGDGKRYQFRIKRSRYDYHSYISYFTTNKEWQTIRINLADMYPTFRGRKLAMANFDANSIEEISILIGNYKAERFNLLIDKIELQ